MTKTAKVETLAQKKQTQLSLSVTEPRLYIVINGYEYDFNLDAYLYTVEIGLQNEDIVDIKTRKIRYSQMYEFDKKIRPFFQEFRYLLPFPPKKYIGNKNPDFITSRMEQLQTYLGNLVRIPGICTSDAFMQTFRLQKLTKQM